MSKLLKIAQFKTLCKAHGATYRKDADGFHTLCIDGVTVKATGKNLVSFSTDWQTILGDKAYMERRNSQVIANFRLALQEAKRLYLEF